MSDFLLNLAARSAGLAASAGPPLMAPQQASTFTDFEVPSDRPDVSIAEVLAEDPVTSTHKSRPQHHGGDIERESVTTGRRLLPSAEVDTVLSRFAVPRRELRKPMAPAESHGEDRLFAPSSSGTEQPDRDRAPADGHTSLAAPPPVDRRTSHATEAPMGAHESARSAPVSVPSTFPRLEARWPITIPDTAKTEPVIEPGNRPLASLSPGREAKPEVVTVVRPALVSPALQVVKPAPAAPSPLPVTPAASRADQRTTHVRIGTIEIRTTAPPAPEPPVGPVAQGFERFRRLRTYARYQG